MTSNDLRSTPLRAGALCALGALTMMHAARADDAMTSSVEALSGMSLAELTNLEVTSVSKSAEPLSQAAAAIYVISHDQIARSGATSVPEALRLAPNLLVTQLSASNFVIAARGLGGNPDDQNFANKILILIDGRSVYTPLYSGVYIDAQEVLLEDVDRIEVISGPGATLWGANAVNGVINIVTRSAQGTQNGLVEAGGGDLLRHVAARYGGMIDESTAYRIYGTAFDRDAEQLVDGASAHDSWDKVQSGFRVDRSLQRDTLTLQGDAYRSSQHQAEQSSGLVSGANLLTRWSHRNDQSEFQAQAYYDQTERFSPTGGGAFVLNTYDVEIQQTLNAGSAQKLIIGAGERLNVYDITNTSTLLFEPTHRALSLGDLFAQDTITLGQEIKLTAGLKAEDDPFSGWALLPDLRLSYQPGGSVLLWGAASRAIRSATPFDDDVVEKLGTRVFLVGNSNFASEKLTAFQLGWRAQPSAELTLSVNGFYNLYSDLRTIEFGPAVQPIPLHWANLMRGETYGIEAWAQWQITDFWRVTPGLVALHEHFHFSPVSSGLLGVAQAGDDPSSHATLTSSLNLPGRMTLDGTLHYVGSLPSPALPSYFQLDARWGWHLSKTVELSLTGVNLLHSHQLEFPTPSGEEIRRGVYAQGQWRF